LILKEKLPIRKENEEGHYQVHIKIIENDQDPVNSNNVESLHHAYPDHGDENPPSWKPVTLDSKEQRALPVDEPEPIETVPDGIFEDLRSLSIHPTADEILPTFNGESVIYSDWAPAENFLSSLSLSVQKDHSVEIKDDFIGEEHDAALQPDAYFTYVSGLGDQGIQHDARYC
jgi:hypothetical protein